jgi:argininosuccinate lyase
MTKIWQSKSTQTHPMVERYTVGNDYKLDKKLLAYDVEASIAHAHALAKLKIITPSELQKLTSALKEIVNLQKQGKFKLKPEDEDCHTAIENYLIKKLGPLGKKIHTGRSRNDQVLVATRLYTRKKLKQISSEIIKLQKVFLKFAQKYQNIPMPGYTHTRRAMPSSVGHWAGAYVEELINDHKILESAYELNDQNPLGAAAGFGVTLPLDRKMTTKMMKFKRTQINSLYAINSRGKTESYVLSVCTQIMMTLGRLANEMVWFTTPEFNYFDLPWEFTTGSSIMPQKRNPDPFELMRANVNVIVGLQTQIKDVCKNLISGYNRDTQLTKEPLIKGMGITRRSLEIASLLMSGIKPNKKVLMNSLSPELFANNEANRLVMQGVPFREAYQRVKENLDKLVVPDPVKAIQEIKSLGGPGNLNLEGYKISKQL